MLAAELTPRTARRERRRSDRFAAFVAEHEELFVLLTTLRAASVESLHVLHFRSKPLTTSLRQAYRAMAVLHDEGFVERQHLNGGRTVYRLTSKGYTSSPRVHRRASDSIRRPLTEALGGYCWLRSSTWGELANRGYRVGRGRDELRAIRRFLIDSQRRVLASASGAARLDAERVLEFLRADPALSPLFRSFCSRCASEGPLGAALAQCRRCGGKTKNVVSELRFQCPRCDRVSDRDEEHESAEVTGRKCESGMREVDHLAFDVAWREASGVVEAVLVIVDDPGRNLRDQLNVLPLRVDGQPKVPVILRSTDEHSVFNPVTGKWIAMGERHRELLRAFSDQGDRRLFPFSTTATVIDIRPELQLRLRPTRKDTSHA